MTKLVADKTPIPFPAWRRHTDPPGLWIAIATGSLALHLLALWFLRSYQFNILRQQQYLSNAVPIEIIEITSPQASSKPALQKPSSTTQPSPSSNLPKAPAQSPSTIEEQDAIAFTNKKIAPTSKATSPATPQRSSQTPIVEQKTATIKPTSSRSVPVTENPQPTTTPFPQISENLKPTPLQTPTNPDTSIPNQNQQISDQQNQAVNPDENTVNSPPGSFPSSNQSQDFQPSQTVVPVPGQPDANISLGKSTPLPTIDPSIQTPPQLPSVDNQTSGGLVASWDAIPRQTMVGLIQKLGLRQNLPPDILAQPQGNTTKDFPIDFLSNEPELESVDLLAVLVIDENGKLISFDGSGKATVEILDITPEKLEDKKSQYQQLVIEIFQDVSFTPARNLDGSKPPLSNLLVQIKIQRL